MQVILFHRMRKRYMIYQEAEQYLLQIPKFKKKSILEDTIRFYEKLGSPAENCKVIHVAGTNGKGSVCCYLASILSAAGYRVGSFTSPHLVSMRERIRIGEDLISEKDFVDCFMQVMDCYKVQIQNVTEDEAQIHPSFFEYLYFMAMIYFEKKQPDFIILETGLGGRKDATNSYPHPILSVITKIGMDHTEYLGTTLTEIAGEKAGIVKTGTDLVYFADNDSVCSVMENTARNKGICTFPVFPERIVLHKVHEKGIDFSYNTGYYDDSEFYLSTKAVYQCENAALAMESIKVLQQSGMANVSVNARKQGLYLARWEGRMEEIMPDVYLDGAHNVDGIEAFLETVSSIPCVGKRILLFSVVEDKDYEKMAKMLDESGLFAKIVLTTLSTARSISGEKITSLFEKHRVLMGKAEDAFDFCLEQKGEQDQVFVAGSLYLVGQIKEYIIK